MTLGEKIYNLRKSKKLSQEGLAEIVNVTRQTISNWELGETSPNPEQLKLLSKALNVSVDELLDNELQNILVEKVNKTEKLSSNIVKILKFLGICFALLLVIDVITFIVFNPFKHSKDNNETETVKITCKLNDSTYKYLIEYDKDDNIIESSGSEFIESFLKEKQFTKGKILVEYIEDYFNDNGGTCK